MSFASDRLWDGYLRQNMSTIVTKVKVREIITHLPCLTAHDREEIEAKRETCGNYNAMEHLLDCLKRRENWPEQFIEGLEACEQRKIAAEMRAEYNALTGINNSSPGSSPITVIHADVHSAPAASHRAVSESVGNSHPAVAPPAETSPATLQPDVQAPFAADQVAKTDSSLVPEPPKLTQNDLPLAPSTLPPSPKTPHSQVAKGPQPEEKIPSHQEPEENSESDAQVCSGDTSLIPAKVSSGNKDTAINVLTANQQPHPVSAHETDTSSQDQLHTAVTTNDKPPQSPSPSQINSNINDGSSFPVLTLEKHPVQDTAPPVNKVPTAVLLPAVTQITESNPQMEPEAAKYPKPPAVGINTFHDEDEDDDDKTVCLSKPGQLISIQPENHASPPVNASNSVAAPYSGNSDLLEISEDTSDTLTLAQSCQENHNEPEENHYESSNQSMDVIENVLHVSEEPSASNLDYQGTEPHLQIIKERSGRSISEPPGSTHAANTTALNFQTKSFNPAKSAAADVSPEPKSQQNSEKKIVPGTTISQSNTAKYFLTAAGVGVVMLLMVWKYKK